MRISSWLSCVLAGVAFCSTVGCSSKSASLVGSGEGESCTRSSDCASPLVCVDLVCVAKGTTPSMDASTGGDTSAASKDTGAPGDSTTVPPGDTGTTGVDSGQPGDGSSVTDTGTIVDTGTAPPPPAPDAGSGTGGSSLLGQACNSTSNCNTGLVCEPRPGAAAGGICDLASYGITPTGMTCTGQCSTAADCCELPVGISLRAPNNVSYNIHQCEDILQNILGGSATVCANQPAPGSATGIGCFYYNTYCNCGPNTWSCTANECTYTEACNLNQANQFGGCATQTRTGAPLVSTCDTTANVCQLVTTGCATDADCTDGVAVADTAGATCRGGDCTCYNQGCYLKCAQDLDCQQGYSCDTTTKLCETAAACSTNGECAVKLTNVDAVCNGGACQLPCMSDHDCSPSGAVPVLGAFNGTVCGAGNVCVPVGCTSNSDCPAPSNGVQELCVTPPAGGSSTGAVHSALTN